MSEPIPTRRENTTRREDGPAPTRREDGDTPVGWPALAPDALPPALAARLTDLTPLPSTGGEAQLLKARDSGDTWC